MDNRIIQRLIKKVYAITYIKYRNRQYLNAEQNGMDTCDNLCHVTHQLTGNSGDTVLSYCVRHTLSHFNNYTWTIFSVRNDVTDSDLVTFNRSKGLVIGGGGLFLPDSNENSISGWQWPCSMSQLSTIKVPIIVYSVGYNYFRWQKPSEFFIENLNALVERAAFVGLRNHGSINAVNALLKDNLKEKVVFQPCTTTIIRKIIKGLPLKKKNNKVAINIAYDRIEKRLGENYEDVLKIIANAMKYIYLRGYEIYCVGHCSFDLNFGIYLKKAGVVFKYVDGEYWLPDKWFRFYNDMEVVIGMRGHAQMIPFGLNTKIISLGSHDKMKWFLEDIEATDWYIELSSDIETLQDNIESTFVRVVEKEAELTEKRLVLQQEKLYNITKDNANIINDILQGRN